MELWYILTIKTLDKNHCNIGMLYYEHYSEEAKKECGYDENHCSIIISGCYYGDVKPYLRSSMTEEEENILYDDHIPFWEKEDYCNKHYLDCRGLIPMELALKAPDGMYEIE